MLKEILTESEKKTRKIAQSRKLALFFNKFELEPIESSRGIEVWYGPQLAPKVHAFLDSSGIVHEKLQAGNNFGLVFAEANLKRIRNRGYSKKYREKEKEG
jgi:hypothetical protein